jgi:hypothetical protein
LGSIKKAGYSLTNWVTVNFSKNILHHWVSQSVKSKALSC